MARKEKEVASKLPLLLRQEHAGVVTFCAAEKQRYVLNAIHYNAAKRRIEATDGHAMICVPVEDAEHPGLLPEEYPELNMPPAPTENTLIPAAALTEAAKASPKSYIKPILDGTFLLGRDGDKLILGSTDLETVRKIEARIPEGTFPEVEPFLVTEEQAKQTITISSDFLARLCAYVNKHGDGKREITFRFQEALGKPIGFSFKTASGHDANGVIMPTPD